MRAFPPLLIRPPEGRAENCWTIDHHVLETNLTVQGNRMNLLKKVTNWAAIIAVLTAVTGFYGQNVSYRGFGKESGFIESSVLMVLLAASLYLCLPPQRLAVGAAGGTGPVAT